MIRLQRILFPTDFSENSKTAQAYACAFAEQFQAELHVVHVLQDLSVIPPPPASMFMVPQATLDAVRKRAEELLANIPDTKWSAGKKVVRSSRVGNPFVEIVRYAREKQIDLIVLGTHGRSGLTHVLLGSVAENVVRKADCPVLTIRPTGHSFVMP